MANIINFQLKRGTTFGNHTFTISSETFDFTGTTAEFIVTTLNTNKEIISISPSSVLATNSIIFDVEIPADETTYLEIGNHIFEFIVTYPSSSTFPTGRVSCIARGRFKIYD